VTGDFNSDGFIDLATANQGEFSLTILYGSASGHFDRRISLIAGYQPISITKADFNGDGKIDLAAANYRSQSVSVFLNLGASGFSSKTDYDADAYPVSVASADLNSDGKFDLVVANQGGASASVLLGVGDGSFLPKVDYVAGYNSWSVNLADFNNDGILDILIPYGNDYNSLFDVLLGKGDGSFYPKISISSEAGWYTDAADLNNDNKVDLVSVGARNSVFVYLNIDSGNTINYTEGYSSVLLNDIIEINDEDLDSLNNYEGSYLHLSRLGGGNAEDVFSSRSGGTLTKLIAGSYFSVENVTIGRVTINSDGILVLAFNGKATRSLVNKAIQQIAYANISDAPPASVQINWTFEDGNTGHQGTGGSLSAT
jgi:hypothetical protein